MTSEERYQRQSIDTIYAVRLIVVGGILLPSMYLIWNQSIYTWNLMIPLGSILAVMAMSALYFLSGLKARRAAGLAYCRITLVVDNLLLAVIIGSIEPSYGTYLYGIFAFYIVGGGAVYRDAAYFLYVFYTVVCCVLLWQYKYAPLLDVQAGMLREVNLGVLTLILLVVAGCLWYLNRKIQGLMVHVEMGEHAADAVHEMKTPLQNLLLMSEQYSVAEETGREMRQEIERISRFLNNYEYLGIKLEPRPEKVHIEALIESAIQSIREISGNAEIDYTISAKKPDLFAFVDEEHARSIFENLIKNAAEAIKEKGLVEIDISDYGSEWLKVSVRDTGTGVGQNAKKKIFNTFYSTKGSRGLGLAIVRKLIIENKGRVHMESTPGHGTLFGVLLQKPEEIL